MFNLLCYYLPSPTLLSSSHENQQPGRWGVELHKKLHTQRTVTICDLPGSSREKLYPQGFSWRNSELPLLEKIYCQCLMKTIGSILISIGWLK
jgi:hypothetical protein